MLVIAKTITFVLPMAVLGTPDVVSTIANGGFGDGLYLSNATGSTIASLSGYVSSSSQLRI